MVTEPSFELKVTDSLARIETKLEGLDDLKATCRWVDGFRSCLWVLTWVIGIGAPLIMGWWVARG